MKIRAKMVCHEVVSTVYSDRVKLQPQYTNNPEDNSYSKATPSGSMELEISNPNVRGQIRAGDVFYVDLDRINPPN